MSDHYALPVRNGVYDFLQLSHHVNEAASAHRQAIKKTKSERSDNPQEKEDPTDSEFLSGFWKTEPPYPCCYPCYIFRHRQLGRTTLPERDVFQH